MKYITVFADASFCDTTKSAGIAMWIRDSTNFCRYSKALTFPVDNPGQAEVIALGSAILKALQEFDHRPGDRISAQSDCLHALDVYAANPKQKKPWTGIEASFRARVLDAVQSAGLTIHAKHVKGHRGNSDPRSAVNTWCDEEARRRMREARELSK